MLVDWPVGPSGLPKPKSGCPDRNRTVRWLDGWLNQSVEAFGPASEWNSDYLEGKALTMYTFYTEMSTFARPLLRVGKLYLICCIGLLSDGKTLFTLWFCIRPDAADAFSLEWPAGDYCIFKHQTCPRGWYKSLEIL